MNKKPDNPVITQEQALKITGANKLLTPELYERAVDLLRQARSLAETLCFQPAAVAWEAWAKYQHDLSAVRLARSFSLEVARQCALHAKKERPGGPPRTTPGKRGTDGSPPGPRTLLMEKGFSRAQAAGAMRLTQLTSEQMDALSRRAARPPALTRIVNQTSTLPVWDEICSHLSCARRHMHATEAALLARALPPARRAAASRLVVEVTDWLDAFEQAIPK